MRTYLASSVARSSTGAAYEGADISLQDAQAAVSHCLETFGKLDILVNCAAGNFLAPASTLSPKGFKTVMDIDAVGTFTMCRASFSALAKSPTPVIVNISATLHHGKHHRCRTHLSTFLLMHSLLTKVPSRAVPGATWLQVHASAAKAAVDSLTRSLALEWGQYGIRVVGVAPGPVEATAGMTKLAPLPENELEGGWKHGKVSNDRMIFETVG